MSQGRAMALADEQAQVVRPQIAQRHAAAQPGRRVDAGRLRQLPDAGVYLDA